LLNETSLGLQGPGEYGKDGRGMFAPASLPTALPRSTPFDKKGIDIIPFYLMPPIFEFDVAKSVSNKEKHGMDFDDAKRLRTDENLLIEPTRFVSETRWIALGMIDGKYWTAVFTRRDDALSIISVRRTRDNEIENYFGRGI
jgi:uncharacterized protein